jgi:hypothetical protein
MALSSGKPRLDEARRRGASSWRLAFARPRTLLKNLTAYAFHSLAKNVSRAFLQFGA